MPRSCSVNGSSTPLAATQRTSTTPKRVFVVVCLVCSCCASIPNRQVAHKPGLPAAALWRSPASASSLNLFYGVGGSDHAPDPRGRFTFIAEDLQATSPKFTVKDQQGVEWKVKLGEEPQSETAATRFLWAAGFFVDEDYYVPEFKLTSAPMLRRGANLIGKDGTVRRARFERKLPGLKNAGPWSWFDNPFVGTREFNGLRTMMAILNNWDLKADNNAIYELGGERRYVVSDVGATFGRTGSVFSGSQSSPGDYATSTFVSSTTTEFVDFELRSRPFFLLAVNLPQYIQRSRMQAITSRIPRADARWLGQRLSALSTAQIRDGFRAAGYEPHEIDTFTQAMRKRIAALDAL